MTKTLASLIVAAFAAMSFNVQAASHAGAAPMAAPADKAAAAAPAKQKAKTAKKAKKATAAPAAAKDSAKKSVPGRYQPDPTRRQGHPLPFFMSEAFSQRSRSTLGAG